MICFEVESRSLDASTSFADETGSAWTTIGNTQVDTAQSKFGGASALFDGTDDYLTTPNSADLNFVGDDATVDLWMRTKSTAAARGIFEQEVTYTDYPSQFAEVTSTAAIRWVIRKSSDGDANVIDLTTSGVTIVVNNTCLLMRFFIRVSH